VLEFFYNAAEGLCLFLLVKMTFVLITLALSKAVALFALFINIIDFRVIREQSIPLSVDLIHFA
jgi:hypothetical protein